MRDDLRGEGQVPMRRERLTIDKLVGNIWLAMFLRTVVQMVSRLQNELEAWNNKLISSCKVV